MNELYIQCIGKDNTLKKLRLKMNILRALRATGYFQQYYGYASGTTTSDKGGY